ncbi:MAG: hypothetical protein GX282_06485, partial [Campylobacteraceae bacterium]|nr:hypothetical protein [Campylobacteraceae bacterium]
NFEFALRTFIGVFIGYFIAYKFAVKLPEILNLSNADKLLFANFFLMIFFISWSMASYVVKPKFLASLCMLFLVMAVMI